MSALPVKMSALTPKADIGQYDWHVRFGPKADTRPFYPIGVLASGPVIITCAITLGSLSYQFGEAATKLLIKNLLDALSARAFIMHQRIKLAFY